MLKKRKPMEKEIDLEFPSLIALWKVETDFSIIKVILTSSRPPRIHFDLKGNHRITVSQEDSSGSFVEVCMMRDGDTIEEMITSFSCQPSWTL
jgi:hypothetical protein